MVCEGIAAIVTTTTAAAAIPTAVAALLRCWCFHRTVAAVDLWLVLVETAVVVVSVDSGAGSGIVVKIQTWYLRAGCDGAAYGDDGAAAATMIVGFWLA